jgi:hypothetical protein
MVIDDRLLPWASLVYVIYSYFPVTHTSSCCLGWLDWLPHVLVLIPTLKRYRCQQEFSSPGVTPQNVLILRVFLG